MDLSQIIRELKEESESVSVAIECLETLMRHGGKRRGRPPAWLKSVGPTNSSGRLPTPRHMTGSRDGIRTSRATLVAEAAPECLTDQNRSEMSAA